LLPTVTPVEPCSEGSSAMVVKMLGCAFCWIASESMICVGVGALNPVLRMRDPVTTIVDGETSCVAWLSGALASCASAGIAQESATSAAPAWRTATLLRLTRTVVTLSTRPISTSSHAADWLRPICRQFPLDGFKYPIGNTTTPAVSSSLSRGRNRIQQLPQQRPRSYRCRPFDAVRACRRLRARGPRRPKENSLGHGGTAIVFDGDHAT